MTGKQEVHPIDSIVRRIAALSSPPGPPDDPAVLEQLIKATEELVAIFKEEGKLDQSPMALALNRSVDLHREAAQARLHGKRVLVTGGAGCVGSRLIPLLATLGAAEIAIVDIACSDGPAPPPVAGTVLRGYAVDIRDLPALETVFSAFRPQVVFHLASIREPGRAEAVVREAIETNVFGTRNVIDACLRHHVEDAIYSSTGKCFAYVSDHVYTGSKKLAEAQWVTAARRHPATRFRYTRFTHIVENGVVTQDIMDGIGKGMVGLHGPDRYFNIQNLRQATHLLVNALALSDQTPPDGFWSAVDLGWPVHTLELALYNIHHSQKRTALYFLGVPRGYDEVFFRGQFSWSGETEYHPLVNALEAPSGFADSTGTMVGARFCPFQERALARELESLRAALEETTTGVAQVKAALVDAVAGLARSVFSCAELTRLVDVLWWGAAPPWAGAHASEAIRFSLVIRLLSDAVIRGLQQATFPIPLDMHNKLREVTHTLAQVPALSLQLEGLMELLLPEPSDAVQAAVPAGT
jgi:hypothetical protein